MDPILRNRIATLDNIDPRRTAVLGIHWQNDVLDPTSAFGAVFSARAAELGLVPRMAHLLDTARARGMTVIYVNVAYTPGHREVVRNNAVFRTAAESLAFTKGTPGVDVIDALPPGPDDFVIEHGRFSAFYGNDLSIILRSQDIDTVVVTGIATNVAVDHTVRDAVQMGYRAILLEDCCCSSNDAFHQASLMTLQALASHVLKAEEFLTATAP